MNYFQYSQKEMSYLSAHDSRLKDLILHCGKIEREVNKDIFDALITSIISQQISGKAAITIKNRLYNLIGDKINAQKICEISADNLLSCGISGKKISYIKTISKAVSDGSINFESIKKLKDEDVISILTSFPGVGRWTAEMILIFSLERQDVISYNDFGIRKGMELLYDIDKINKKEFLKISEAYHPYATIASFYLWYAANNNIKI